MHAAGIFGVLLAGAVSVASAAATGGAALSLDLGAEAGIVPVRYACGAGGTIPVQYVNAGANSLALIEIDNTARIFVSVISGSGARYVSGPYEWWSKGDTATLTDLTDEATTLDCVAREVPTDPPG